MAKQMEEKTETEEYWEELEEELGEKVRWFCIGELLEPFCGIGKNTVGMFFLTDTYFYFQTFPRNDFLKTLANSFRKKKKGGERIQHGVERAAIESADFQKPKGLARLTAPSMAIYTINFTSEETGQTLRFNLLDKTRGQEMMKLLTERR